MVVCFDSLGKTHQMKIVYSSERLVEETPPPKYDCETCKRGFDWGKNSRWWGSWKDAENGFDVPKFCSPKCADDWEAAGGFDDYKLKKKNWKNGK